jgi:diguanylate cyclase (GGDEF)-like protein
VKYWRAVDSGAERPGGKVQKLRTRLAEVSGAADSPVAQSAQLRQFLRWLIPLVIAFALLEGLAFVNFGDESTGITSVVLFGFASLMAAAWILASRGARTTAIIIICGTFLVATLVMVPVMPHLIPTLAVSPLMAVAVALPYASGRTLGALIITAWLTTVCVAALGEMIPPSSGVPSWYGSFFSVASLATAVAVILLLLWQFKTRLMASLAAAREAKERLRHEATHDPLTGLPNRALFMENLAAAMERSAGREREDPPSSFALLFLDLDRFKNVNDSLGHGIGDLLLVGIARRIEDCMRETDTVARLSGDEFVALLEDLDGPEDAATIAGRIQSRLQTPFKIYGHELFTTASIGVVVNPADYEEPEELLRDADTAMYRAKDGGKARHVVFDRTMRTRAVSLLRLETDLRRAVEFDEFVVHYQPIIHLSSGRVYGFEALVRWDHPERGMVPPGVFIALAEETGLIVPIGLSVLREACRQTALWRERFPDHRPLGVSVNLSAAQLIRPDFPDEVSRILEETKIGGRDLTLEITESAIMADEEIAAKALSRLTALGVKLHVDDFGTGYSSLGRLHEYPVAALKVDRSFVRRMGAEASGENAEIVETIITLARQLGMNVVSEGIETHEQLDRLRDIGCDYGQGYLFSRPVPAEAAEALLAADRVWR